jgi:hypothetical protein
VVWMREPVSSPPTVPQGPRVLKRPEICRPVALAPRARCPCWPLALASGGLRLPTCWSARLVAFLAGPAVRPRARAPVVSWELATLGARTPSLPPTSPSHSCLGPQPSCGLGGGSSESRDRAAVRPQPGFGSSSGNPTPCLSFGVLG